MSNLRGRSTVLALPVVVLLAALSLGGATGCGKPDYCSERDDLAQSVKALGDVNVLQSGGLDRLRTQLDAVESDARAVADSAKSDFPDESGAVRSSVETLKGTLDELPASPSPEQLAPVAVQAAAVVSSFQEFDTATDAECS